MPPEEPGIQQHRGPCCGRAPARCSQACQRGEAGGAKAAQQLSAGKSETSPGCLIKPPCGLLEIHHTALEIVPTILTPLGSAGSTGRAFVWGFWTLLVPCSDAPRFVSLRCSAACRRGEKPSPVEGMWIYPDGNSLLSPCRNPSLLLCLIPPG